MCMLKKKKVKTGNRQINSFEKKIYAVLKPAKNPIKQ